VLSRRRNASALTPKCAATGPPTGQLLGYARVARSSALLQGLEVGTTRIAGHLPDLEQAAITWQAGQHQPDALAATVVAHDVLVHSIGQRWGFASPLDSERRAREGNITSLPTWMTRRISG
jgi:hypothetical protein